MLTNLVAAAVITLVTNTVPSDNAVSEQDYNVAYATNPIQWGQRIKTPATERYSTTTVTEHTEITVMLHGKPKTFMDDRLLSSVTTIMRKQEEWKAAGVRTNETEVASSANYFTNVAGIWTITTNAIITVPSR